MFKEQVLMALDRLWSNPFRSLLTMLGIISGLAQDSHAPNRRWPSHVHLQPQQIRSTMFLQATPDELRTHTPQFTVLNVPEFHAVPQVDGNHSDVFIILNFARRLALIGGTAYAGEIKKSIDLAERFITNFAQFAATVTPEVREAGPHQVLVA